jgi:hypothetical protein
VKQKTDAAMTRGQVIPDLFRMNCVFEREWCTIQLQMEPRLLDGVGQHFFVKRSFHWFSLRLKLRWKISAM